MYLIQNHGARVAVVGEPRCALARTQALLFISSLFESQYQYANEAAHEAGLLILGSYTSGSMSTSFLSFGCSARPFYQALCRPLVPPLSSLLVHQPLVV